MYAPGVTRLVQGWDSDAIAEDHHILFRCNVVQLLADAVQPSTEDRAQAHLPASDPVSGRADRMLGIDGGQASGGTAPFTGSRGTWVFFVSVCSPYAHTFQPSVHPQSHGHPGRRRTLRTKLSFSWRQLATSSRT